MHWKRRLARGANSPEVLAEKIAGRLRIPVLKRALRQVRNTLPQKGLPPKRRWQNVRGAFGLRAGYGLGGARVALVDDVLTTGATCSEAARILKIGGASHVVAVVLARAHGTDIA
jgi:predicted amidophosphoribosyltransferase